MIKGKIVLRVISSPLVLGILLVFGIYYVLKTWKYYLVNGGEFITYDETDSGTIAKIYNKLKKNNYEY